MDRLNPQTAGCFERSGKQCTRLAKIIAAIVRRLTILQIGQFSAQLLIIGNRPVAKPLEQAGEHLVCRGFGVGDAKNRVRRRAGASIRALQEQTRNAVDQNLCLARARIGFHPG